MRSEIERSFKMFARRARFLLAERLPGDKWRRLINARVSVSRDYGSKVSFATEAPEEPGVSEVRSGRIPEAKKRVPDILGPIVSLVSSGHAMRLHEHVDEMHRKLGPIYRDRVGPVDAIFVNSPDEFLKIFRMEGPTPMHFLPEAWGLYNGMRQCPRGLLFMDGEEWQHFRRIINRVMLVPNPADTMAGPCEEAARDLVEGWRRFADTGDAIPDLSTRLYRWSIEVMLATLTGSSWHSYKSQVATQTQNLATTLHRIFATSARLSLLPAKYAMKLRLPVWREFCSVADDALTIVRSLVSEMARLEGSDGLLAMMSREGIRSEADLVRIVTDLVMAAGDTTAFSTQWSLFLLAKNPDVQEKLYQRVSGLGQREILSDAFVRAVVKEAMRLYPVAPFLTRFMAKDAVIAGYPVSKEELLIMSVYSSSRDPKNFPQPNKFLPERWLRNERRTYELVANSHGSLPFAFGVRSCVGRRLAETQMILTLSETNFPSTPFHMTDTDVAGLDHTDYTTHKIISAAMRRWHLDGPTNEFTATFAVKFGTLAGYSSTDHVFSAFRISVRPPLVFMVAALLAIVDKYQEKELPPEIFDDSLQKFRKISFNTQLSRSTGREELQYRVLERRASEDDSPPDIRALRADTAETTQAGIIVDAEDANH